MKRALSVLFIIVIFCMFVVFSASASDISVDTINNALPDSLLETNKISRRTLDYFANNDADDVVRINIEYYSDLRIMDRNEYYWRHDVDLERASKDKDYAWKWGMEHYNYQEDLYKVREAQMLDFYNREIKISDDYSVLTIPAYNILRAYVRISDIERILKYDEVVCVYSNQNSDGVGNDVLFGCDTYGVIGENYCVNYLGCEFDPDNPYDDFYVYGFDSHYVYFQGRKVQNEGYSEEIIGDVIFGSEFTHTPDNPTGYFAMGDGEIMMPLSQALEKNRVRIGIVAMELPYVYYIGDADYDYKLTIMDATSIQRLIACIDSYKDVVCVSRPEDKDRDGKVSIMDATSVQRELALLN